MCECVSVWMCECVDVWLCVDVWMCEDVLVLTLAQMREKAVSEGGPHPPILAPHIIHTFQFTELSLCGRVSARAGAKAARAIMRAVTRARLRG